MAGARVELFDPLSLGQSVAVTTNPEGQFLLDGITPGRRSVRVSKQGYLTQVAAGIEVVSGQRSERVVRMEASQDKKGFEFQGIGAVLTQREDGIVLMELMPDSPAQAFGLKPGDMIRRVDGEDASEMRLIDVINMIRGEAGVPVSIEIERPGEGALTVDVERGSIRTK